MKRHLSQIVIVSSILFLFSLACVATTGGWALSGAHQNQDVQQANQSAPYVLRTNVDLVVLRATVRDHKGAPISGLGKENFQVFEDKVLQPIESFSHEDVPVTIGLVIDNSGSMRPKHADVTVAALAFVRSSNPDDQIFVVNFTSMFRWAFRPTCPSQITPRNWRRR